MIMAIIAAIKQASNHAWSADEELYLLKVEGINVAKA